MSQEYFEGDERILKPSADESCSAGSKLLDSLMAEIIAFFGRNSLFLLPLNKLIRRLS